MKFRTLLVVLLTFVPLDAGARCGPSRVTRNVEKPQIIALAEPQATPSFYLQITTNPNRKIVAFFKPEEVVEGLRRWSTAMSTNNQNAGRSPPQLYLEEILKDLPLKRHTDLFSYTLLDDAYQTPQNAIVQYLLRAGRASIMEEPFAFDHTDTPRNTMKTITMVERRPDSEGMADARWFCAPDDLLLFGFYNVLE